ncbi:putative NBD/HSP70 family sugar kinase [Paenibacillus endophyticus]|uniref:Putative NBD/HSP70 family sugar kinase n=1 Tax=Paenibacillus endophyticus TaxID=1294268 RepID=A0A7W5C4B6_9BACL|nr:ROK family protein [Paenibacillus endophyticus]MBB3150950.1 putative NBD/HSP70 family sugar kinase [Paenibacillus endophyticus]
MKIKPTGDLALIKKINTAIVLEAVLKHAPLSRAQISELTGLNKATVSSLVQDLIDSHLVLENGPGQSSGGRKPVMLLFNGTAGYAVGIDLGVNYIRGMLVDMEGNVIAELQRGLKQNSEQQRGLDLQNAELQRGLNLQNAEQAIDQLTSCIELLIKEAPNSPYGIVGIGVGVPGIVDDNGTILFAPNLKWRQVELQKQLEERFGLPVTIDNEANAGAQGEQKYGAGRGIPNQIYVSVGIGIGTGIILNKELYKGTSGFSGELGHLSIEYDGKPCSCGNRGCWELYASENALLERASLLGYESLEELLEAAAEDDERVVALIRSIGDYLGAGIANIVNVFNPDVVIIGNRMSRAAQWLEPAVQAAVDQRTLPYHRERMRILFAELKDQSAVRGAAYYAISTFFSKIKSGQ